MNTGSQMPMGQVRSMQPIDMSSLMPTPPTSRPAAAAEMPQQAAGLMQPNPGTMLPPPGSPAEPPFEVQMQADGSSVYLTKTVPPVVIGVNPAPKLPKSMQEPDAKTPA